MQPPSQSPDPATEHQDDYGKGARKTAITDVQPLETSRKGLEPEQCSGFASAKGHEGPASEGGGH